VAAMSEPHRVCGIPACTLPPCDDEWGHDGDLHSNAGDGFYARDYDEEHHRRQAERQLIAEPVDELVALRRMYDALPEPPFSAEVRSDIRADSAFIVALVKAAPRLLAAAEELGAIEAEMIARDRDFGEGVTTVLDVVRRDEAELADVQQDLIDMRNDLQVAVCMPEGTSLDELSKGVIALAQKSDDARAALAKEQADRRRDIDAMRDAENRLVRMRAFVQHMIAESDPDVVRELRWLERAREHDR